jgi:hypothetical protein
MIDDTSVPGAAPAPWNGIGTTAIGSAAALPPTMSISRPLLLREDGHGQQGEQQQCKGRGEATEGACHRESRSES